MKPVQANPVKLLAGLLYSDDDLMRQACRLLESEFGSIDYKSSVFNFKVTDYYEAEMGSAIFRFFISFTDLIDPGDLPAIKLRTNQVEETLKIAQCRKVNIDSGYMDYDKVVLASAKYNRQKIYLGQGIWADPTLHYTKGIFKPYAWSFPDFKAPQYAASFLEIRQRYKLQMKKTH